MPLDRNNDASDEDLRTRLSEDRTIMANERTYSSWTGTGLGALGMGIAVQALFKATEPTWIAKIAATVFIAVAIAFFVTAWRNSIKTLENLRDHASAPARPRQLAIISGTLVSGSLVITAILWTL